MSAFDVYRVSRALDKQLTEGDRIDVVASDDISRDYWVLTTRELIIVREDVITTRVPLERIATTVRPLGSGVEVRVRDTAGGTPVRFATFRRANKLTRRIVDVTTADADES